MKKKYFFEATKRQWEKPTEPKQYLCATAKEQVIAESEEEAMEIAKKKFHEDFNGTGTVLGEIRLTGSVDLHVDWSYGYGDARVSANEEQKRALREASTL